MVYLIYEGNEFTKYRAPLDPSYIVYVIFKESDKYKPLFSHIKDIAYTDMNRKLIIINGEKVLKLSGNNKLDYINVIIAHELAHHYLKHKAIYGDTNQEMEADLGAYYLLMLNNKRNASQLLKGQFKTRNKISFEQYDKENAERIIKKLQLKK